MRGSVGRVRGRVAVLDERPFRLFWLGRFSSAVGSALIPVALPFAVLSVGGGVREIGYVLAAFVLSSALLAVAGGVWADRLPRRLVMIGCDVVSSGVQALTAVALFAGVMKWWMFVVTAMLVGGATAFFGAASTGLVPAIVRREHLQQTNGLLGLTRNVTEIFGPAVSGIVVAGGGPAWVFAIDAATFAVSAAFLLALNVQESIRAVRRRFLADLAEGLRDVRSRRWLSTGIAAYAILNLGLAPFLVLGPIIAQRDLGGASAWGAIATGGAVGGAGGAVLGYRLRPSRPLLACFAVALLAILPPLALLPPLPALAIAVANAAFELGLAFGGVVWVTTLQREIPEDRISRVSSLDWAVSFLFLPVGLALTGPLAGAIGIHATLMTAIALIVAAAVGAMLTRPVRELRTPGHAPR
jgi:MFS family permease